MLDVKKCFISRIYRLLNAYVYYFPMSGLYVNKINYTIYNKCSIIMLLSLNVYNVYFGTEDIFMIKSNKKVMYWLLYPTYLLETEKCTLWGGRGKAHLSLFLLFQQLLINLLFLMSEINPENFRSISQRLAILQNNLENGAKCWSVKYRTAYKMWTRSRDFTKFSGWYHVINI